MEAVREGRLIIVRVPLEGGGRLVVSVNDDEAKELAAEWRRSCLEMPDPEMTAMFDHAYTVMDDQLTAQRDEFAAYLASFEDDAA